MTVVEEMGDEDMGKGSETDEPLTEEHMAELAAEEVRGA